MDPKNMPAWATSAVRSFLGMDGRQKGQGALGLFLIGAVIIVAAVMLSGVGSTALDIMGDIANTSTVDKIVTTGNDTLKQLASSTRMIIAIILLFLVVAVVRVFGFSVGGGGGSLGV